MSVMVLPRKQIRHKYIDKAIDQWLDIHFGDASFNGRVVLGHRKHGGGIYTMTARSLSELRPYVRMIHASQRLDYYITANTISGITRKESELFGLQNIVIDIDCHEVGKDRDIQALVQAFIWRTKRDLWNSNVLPSPNSIVRTGRGVQLWWALVPCYGGRSYGISRYHYDKIKNNLMDHLEVLIDEYPEELGGLSVDRGASSNPVGYFRMPLTYNTAAGRYGSLEILHTKRHDQRELTLLPAPETHTLAHTHNHVSMLSTDVTVLRGFHSTGVRRVMQLIKLRNLRDNEIGSEERDFFNFSVYNALRMSLDHDAAMVRLRAFNSGFKQPMSDDELQNCVCTANKRGGYKYTNAKVIELLSVTPEEQAAIGLHPFRGKYRPWTTSKPNASRDAARRAVKQDRDSKIYSMLEQGVSQAEIARHLKIGKNTVGRVVKRLREQTPDVVLAEISVQNERHHFGSIYVLRPSASTQVVSVGDGQYDPGG